MDVIQLSTSRATIRPWVDPVVDFDPRSAYVERYWLGVIGPTVIALRTPMSRDTVEAT